ncbi:MAG: tyrosine-type recombinase/integrase [Clostridiales Family XIII bacterium]|jgi:integrase/recombinase XerD|nr:tyrosine-type recombinase/integrase [Clostridiales Family XIII bacterium]
MAQDLRGFEKYLVDEKRLSVNSVSAYIHDIPGFEAYLGTKGTHSLLHTTGADISGYLLKLKSDGRSGATVNRKLASLRAYYRFLIEKNRIKKNPCEGIRSPRIQRSEIEYLSTEEIDKLLAAPDDSDTGRRDAALLEMMYATGMRVTEAMYLKVEDVNIRMGFVTCDGSHGKARIIPLGRMAREALEKYIFENRPHLKRRSNEASDGPEESALFLNYYGERITRQALWKIIRGYAAKVGIDRAITPQILRNTFAVHMVQGGADIKALQEMMGHEDPMTTQAYLSVSKNRIKDVYDSAHPRA